MYQEYLSCWIELIVRRRRVLLTVFTVVFALVVLGTAFWPPTYESTAQIMVRDDRAQLLVAPNLSGDSGRDATIVSNPVSQEDLNSEVELLTSYWLIDAAVRGVPVRQRDAGPAAVVVDAIEAVISLPALGYGALHHAPSLTPRDSWVLTLRRRLKSQVIKRSNVIEVAYSSHDARWSREFLARVLNQYLEYHARISHDPEAEKFFANQAQQLKSQLFQSEEKLREFQLRNGIANLPNQNQALVTQLSELQLDYKKNAVQLASARQRAESLERLLAATPERIENESKSVQNLALAQIKPQVLQLEAERADLLSRYQPNSLRVREVEAKLNEARKILDRENHLEIQERSSELNPVWVTLDTDLVAANADIESLVAGQAGLSAEIKKSEESISLLVNEGVELNRLQRQVETDSNAYLTYVRKTEEARVAHALNASRILNVSISQAPLLPLKPVAPIVWMNLGLGFLFALGAGAGAAKWEEERDPKLYSSAAIAEVSGLSIVTVLRD